MTKARVKISIIKWIAEKQSHSCVFKMIDKINNLLARLNKGQEKITKIRQKRGGITTDQTEKIRITRETINNSVLINSITQVKWPK